MKYREASYSGTQSDQISDRELRNRIVAKKVATEGIVLLKNNGVLPLADRADVALYGSGALYTIKGGTGSGDVNERETVSIYEGMINAGFVIRNEAWLNKYQDEYTVARQAWKQKVLKIAEAAGGNAHTAFVNAYVNYKFQPPIGPSIYSFDVQHTEKTCAIYVLSRQSGEGLDRHVEKGDYYISDEEEEQLSIIRTVYDKVVLVLNCGGPIDLQFTERIAMDAIVFISQPGMEGGNAFADIISGAVSPSGKMTDTWAKQYSDYPNAETFSHCNGNVEQEVYEEGIYVGYRYFDTFGVKPFIPFGFGMSYTDFQIKTEKYYLQNDKNGSLNIYITVDVKNTGVKYAGKNIVQVYASCPQTRIKKEFQRLCTFEKTPVLAPQQSCKMELSFPLIQLASFSEKDSAYVLEAGDYILAVGDSSDSNEVFCILRLLESVEAIKVDHICPLQMPLQEIEPDQIPKKHADNIDVLVIYGAQVKPLISQYLGETPEHIPGEAGKFVDTLQLEQLLSLTSGDPAKGHGSSDTFGSSGITVPGAAGETHCCAKEEPWKLASIVLADGPAGVRLTPNYYVDANGRVLKPSFKDSIERGFFSEKKENLGAKLYHQFCTGFPVGTMCAQTWNTNLMFEMGCAVAEEMIEFGISLWLAPGMNIHRNPLCGRNFEYYSEDPLLTGVIAAALTRGVQSMPGIGVTVKHLACNNQEDNRKHSNSIVSERALREIYLHGFEIAVKNAQPMAIMPSYNLINGVHAANSYDLITKVARSEWGFRGVVVSDWTTTGTGGASPVECIKAGTDLIMPGSFEDITMIRRALDLGELDIKEVKKCVSHLVNIIWQSLEYEGCKPYWEQFKN